MRSTFFLLCLLKTRMGFTRRMRRTKLTCETTCVSHYFTNYRLISSYWKVICVFSESDASLEAEGGGPHLPSKHHVPKGKTSTFTPAREDEVTFRLVFVCLYSFSLYSLSLKTNPILYSTPARNINSIPLRKFHFTFPTHHPAATPLTFETFHYFLLSREFPFTLSPLPLPNTSKGK